MIVSIKFKSLRAPCGAPTLEGAARPVLYAKAVPSTRAEEEVTVRWIHACARVSDTQDSCTLGPAGQGMKLDTESQRD